MILLSIIYMIIITNPLRLMNKRLPANLWVWFGDEEADLTILYAICISWVDTDVGPAVRLTAVYGNQHDAKLSIAQPARHVHHQPISQHSTHIYLYSAILYVATSQNFVNFLPNSRAADWRRNNCNTFISVDNTKISSCSNIQGAEKGSGIRAAMAQKYHFAQVLF